MYDVPAGCAFGQGPKATMDYGLWMLPYGMDDTEAAVNYGVMVSTQCRYACFAMRAGNTLAWEESAQIASRYDHARGRRGQYNGDTPVFEVNAHTGEIRVNGRPVKVEYP